MKHKKVLPLFLALCLIFSLSLGALPAAGAAADGKEVNIFGIGDFGGALDDSGTAAGNPGAVRLVGEMKQLTGEYPNSMVISGGTLYTGSALSFINQGKPVNDMLKAMGAQFVTLGNHDFDWSNPTTRAAQFSTWESDGGFAFINANIYYKSGPNAGQRALTPYGVTTVDGVKIGLFGVIDPANASAITAANIADLEFRDPVEAGVEMVSYLRNTEKCGVVIALAHIGGTQALPEVDSPVSGSVADFISGVNAGVASAGVKGLDGVFSSQTASPMCGVVDGTPVVQAASRGQAIDRLSISVDSAGAVTVTPAVYPLTEIVMGGSDVLGSDADTRANIPEDPAFKVIYDQYNADSAALLAAPCGTSDRLFDYTDHQFDYFKWCLEETYDYLNDVYGEGVDAYFQNTGGYRNLGSTVIRPGDPITLRLLYTIMPFDNAVVTMDMKGSDIVNILECYANDPDSPYYVGPYTTCLQYGFDVTYVSGTNEANGPIASIKLHSTGEPLDPDATYRVACNTFMYPGNGDNMNFNAGTDVEYTNVLCRDAIYQALLQQSAAVKFGDVAGHWAEPYINALAALGYVNGTGGGNFTPDGPLTRAQFVQILYNVFGEGDTSAPAGPFADVAAGQWYAGAVNWACADGLVNGVSPTAFEPDTVLTREQMAALAFRAAEKFGISLPAETALPAAFADDGQISDYARAAVYAMRAAGVIDGRPGDVFDPQGGTARGEVTKVVYLLLQLEQ